MDWSRRSNENRRIKELTSLGSAELLKGASKEEVVTKITKTGFPEDKAKLLVDDIAVQLGLAEAPKEVIQEEVVEDSETEKENPVDRYIW